MTHNILLALIVLLLLRIVRLLHDLSTWIKTVSVVMMKGGKPDE